MKVGTITQVAERERYWKEQHVNVNIHIQYNIKLLGLKMTIIDMLHLSNSHALSAACVIVLHSSISSNLTHELQMIHSCQFVHWTVSWQLRLPASLSISLIYCDFMQLRLFEMWSKLFLIQSRQLSFVFSRQPAIPDGCLINNHTLLTLTQPFSI